MSLALYRRVYDPDAQLVLIGGHGHPRYTQAVSDLVHALGLKQAVRMPGMVGEAELARAYADSDVFVCLSDHEGFCFPLVEAMHHGLPIVAFGAAAVPDTVGAGGVVLDNKEPATVAAAVNRVLSVPGRRARLVAAGRARVAELSVERVARRMIDEVRRGLHGTVPTPVKRSNRTARLQRAS
jgi:glycosyltransferase involved in cell wall biosynthesis